jgi:hypothetical protein
MAGVYYLSFWLTTNHGWQSIESVCLKETTLIDGHLIVLTNSMFDICAHMCISLFMRLS